MLGFINIIFILKFVMLLYTCRLQSVLSQITYFSGCLGRAKLVIAKLHRTDLVSVVIILERGNPRLLAE